MTQYDYTSTKFNLITENGKITIKDLKNNYAEETFTFESVGKFETEYNLVLGALANNDSIVNLCKYKIYSCKIYEGDELIRDYVPVKNNMINIAGLYDKVEKKFYNSRGNEDFKAGMEWF